MTISVVIADDHGSVREGLKLLLNTHPDFLLLGEAEDGNGAIHLAHTLQPDVLLTDLNMPGPDGIEVAAALRKQAPAVRVLILTLDDDPAVAHQALNAGASGFVSKLSPPTELLTALAVVASGERYLRRDEPRRDREPAWARRAGSGRDGGARLPTAFDWPDDKEVQSQTRRQM